MVSTPVLTQSTNCNYLSEIDYHGLRSLESYFQLSILNRKLFSVLLAAEFAILVRERLTYEDSLAKTIDGGCVHTSDARLWRRLGLCHRHSCFAARAGHAESLDRIAFQSSESELGFRARATTRVVICVDQDGLECFSVFVNDVLSIRVCAIVAGNNGVASSYSKSTEVGTVERSINVITPPPVEEGFRVSQLCIRIHSLYLTYLG